MSAPTSGATVEVEVVVVAELTRPHRSMLACTENTLSSDPLYFIRASKPDGSGTVLVAVVGL